MAKLRVTSSGTDGEVVLVTRTLCSKQRGHAETIVMLVLFLGGLGTLLVNAYWRTPATFDEVQAIVSNVRGNRVAEQIVAQALKEHPHPTKDDLETLKGQLDRALVGQLTAEVAGQHATSP